MTFSLCEEKKCHLMPVELRLQPQLNKASISLHYYLIMVSEEECAREVCKYLVCPYKNFIFARIIKNKSYGFQVDFKIK